MKFSVVALTLSLLSSVFGMEVKDVRKPTKVESMQDAEERGAIVPFTGEQSIVLFNPEAEAAEWIQDAVVVDGKGLEEYHNYTGAITMFSPEALAKLSCAIDGTCSFLFYAGTQVYCISKVSLIMAQTLLANAEIALDKAEEVEEGVKKVLDKAENVAERFNTVHGEFQKDYERANNLFESKK